MEVDATIARPLAVFAVFLFLTYYLEQNLGYSPLKTGLRARLRR